MKFITLEILNLASLDRPDGERIDFEEGVLGKSNIFSIVGPTGSGKSTLLDAICLALYGCAPRYPKRSRRIAIYGTVSNEEKNRPSPTDCRNILTRGKKDCYSKLTFQDNKGEVYRAEWSVHFKVKEYDAPETHLYKILPDGSEAEDKWENIPTIIGLDYEQFLRTVLIAQGTFANFLNANEDERYALLEKLIDSEEQYKKIAEKINQKFSEADKDYTTINTQHSTYEKDRIEETELEQVKARAAQLEEEDRKAKADLAEVVKAIGWYDTEDTFIKNITTYEGDFKTAKQNQTDYKPQADRLDLHDATVDAVKYYLDYIGNQETIKKLEGTLKTLGEEIKTTTSDIATGNSELTPLNQAVQAAAAELNNQRPHINKARTLKGELAKLEETLGDKKKDKEAADEALKKANEAVKENTQKLASLTEAKEKAANEQATLKEKIEKDREEKAQAAEEAEQKFEAKAAEIDGLDAATLQRASNAARDKETDIASAIRIRKAIAEKKEKQEKDQGDIDALEARDKKIDAELATLTIEALKTELATLRETHTLMTSEDWTRHRADLAEGKACPLCGATHHPYSSDAEVAPVVSGLEKLIGEKEAALDDKEKLATKLNTEKGQNSGKISTLTSGIATLAEDLEKLQEEWTPLHAKYPDWPEDSVLLEPLQSLFKSEAEKAQKALKDYNDKAAEKEELRKKKEAAEKALQAYDKDSGLKTEAAQKKVDDAEYDIKTEQGKTQLLLKQQKDKSDEFNAADKAFNKADSDVNAKKQQLRVELGDKDPDMYEQQLEKAKQDAEDAVKTKEDAIGKLNTKLSGLKGQVNPTEYQKTEEERKESQNKGLLDSWLAAYNAAHAPEQQLDTDKIKEVSGYNDNWEEVRQKKDQLQQEYTAADTTLENEKKKHVEHQDSKPEEDLAVLKARQTELEKRNDTELVNLKARLQKHDAAVHAMGAAGEQLKTAEAKKKAWENINAAIGGSDGKRLRKIAQCYTLSFLIEHANAEIRKFNSRYELLQVPNSLGIRVIDHDRADDVRDTTSLSGGETFIVSLGLALGLSSLSSRNISFENLFVDEGFGSLDPDTLGTVIDSLAMLQSSQGKKVGVISHTDTMSERITTQIRVIKKSGSAGSSYIELYPS